MFIKIIVVYIIKFQFCYISYIAISSAKINFHNCDQFYSKTPLHTLIWYQLEYTINKQKTLNQKKIKHHF